MARRITLADARSWLKPRPISAHKGTSGRVLVIAGSRGMAGAAVLCATGAVRAGAGLVKVATVKSQQPVVAKRAPLETTSAALPEDSSGRLSAGAWPAVKRLLKEWNPDVIAVGPGLGLSPAVVKVVENLLSQNGLRVVVDADGLNALATSKFSRGRLKPAAEFVMTPHVGELARLLSIKPACVSAERNVSAKQAVAKYGGVCLLKGPGTLIASGASRWKNTTGNPGMASGGMGDLLTGMIAALWAQDRSAAWRAAALGAFAHGLAGDIAARKFSQRSTLASDVASFIPAAFKKITSFPRKRKSRS